MSKKITISSNFGISSIDRIGVLATYLNNNIQPVELTHSLEPFDLGATYFHVLALEKRIKKPSIHLIINDIYKPNQRFLALKKNENWFLSADNGLFHMLVEKWDDAKIVELKFTKTNTPEIDILVKASLEILEDQLEEQLYNGELHIGGIPNPIFDKDLNHYLVTVIQVDEYGNLISNITKNEIKSPQNVEIILNRFKTIKGIHSNLFEAMESLQWEDSGLFAYFNEFDYLQIGVFRGHSSNNTGASSLYRLNTSDNFIINL